MFLTLLGDSQISNLYPDNMSGHPLLQRHLNNISGLANAEKQQLHHLT